MATEGRPHYTRSSIGALVAGLVSLPAAFLPFGIVVALAAVVLGFIGRREAIASARPLKLANAAIVLGAIGVLIWILVITGFALFAWLYEG